MRNVVRLIDHRDGGFVSRGQGERLRNELTKEYERLDVDHTLVIDFNGVDTMTPSFADECFGKLAEKIGVERFRKAISLVGADETIKTLVNSVLALRLTERQ